MNLRRPPHRQAWARHKKTRCLATRQRVFSSAEGLLGQDLSNARVFEHAGQRIAQNVAYQLGVGVLVRCHAEALVERRAVTAAVAAAAILHVGTEGGTDRGFR